MVEYTPNNQIEYRIKIFSEIKLYICKIIITTIMKKKIRGNVPFTKGKF